MSVDEFESYLAISIAKELDNLMNGLFIMLFLLVIGMCGLASIMNQQIEIENLQLQLQNVNTQRQKRKRRRSVQDDIVINDVNAS